MTRDLEFIRKQSWYTPGSDKLIIIDFDGTICEHRYPKEGDLMADVIEALDTLRKSGFKVVIHSARTSTIWSKEEREGNYMRMKSYLEYHHIPYDDILTYEKIPALAYVDDSAFRIEGNYKKSNWIEVVNKIKNLK